jgi:ADP-ribose pyrophosphatase YjhB (NUDIX family)
MLTQISSARWHFRAGREVLYRLPLGQCNSNQKTDKEDENDKAVAIRETSEEIGLDLTSPQALFIGNLPERVVSTSFGRQPIMVLCPFVWLWTGSDIPSFKLQPTEVASTHWVPLRVLLAPSARTHEYVDVSDRFAHRGSAFLKAIIRSVLGKMRFSAIRLTPSESLYCSSTAEFFSPPEENRPETSMESRLYNWYQGDHAGAAGSNRPLLLWGLTLGVLADFLDQLPPYNAVELWSYPTFTSWDVRFIIDILTIPLKRRNEARLRNSGANNETAIDSETEAVSGDNPWFIGGLSKGMETSKKEKNATKTYAVGILLEDYYAMARRGVWISAGIRAITTILFGLYIVRRHRQRVWGRSR